MNRRLIAAMMSFMLTIGSLGGAYVPAMAKEVDVADEQETQTDYQDASEAETQNDTEYQGGADAENYKMVEYDDNTTVGYSKQNSRDIFLRADAPSLEVASISTIDNEVSITVISEDNEAIIGYLFCKNGKIIQFEETVKLSSINKDTEFGLQPVNQLAEEYAELAQVINAEVSEAINKNMPFWREHILEMTGNSLEYYGIIWDEVVTDDVVGENVTVEAETTFTGDELTTEDEILISDEEILTEDEEETIATDEETSTEDGETLTENDETVTADENLTSEEEITELNLEETLPVHAERIELNVTKTELYVGQTLQLRASVYPENATESVVFSTTSDAVVTVTPNGLVTAKGVGITTVHADCDGLNVDCTIEVSNDAWDVDPGIEIADGVWMDGFKDELTYTGAKITQDVIIYDQRKRLAEKVDYVITYANNINAASSDQLKSPSMTITMRGQYSGKKTCYFAIKPRSIQDVDITTDKIGLNYTGRDQKYVPIINYGNKRLVNNKDFTISYDTTDFKGEDGSKTEIGYVIHGIGNFDDGAEYPDGKHGSYYILGRSYNLSKATLSLTANVKYTGNPITADMLNMQLGFPGVKEKIDPSSQLGAFDILFLDYSDPNNDTIDEINGIGKYKVIITPKNPDSSFYAGKIEKNINVTGGYVLNKVAEVNTDVWAEELPFDIYYANYDAPTWGGIKMATDDLLRAKADGGLTDDKLKRGTDYSVTYMNNKKAGTAKVVFKGIGKCTGSITKTYKIVSGGKLKAYVASGETYMTGGTKPQVSFSDESDVTVYLKENVDYTLTCTNNKNVGEATYKIVGKGNFKNAEIANAEGTFNITPASLSRCKVVVADKVYNARAGLYKSVPTVYDSNGKKLVAGKDYSKEYQYIGYDDTSVPEIGERINVKINGIGNFAGSSVTGYYHVFDSKKNVTKLQIVINPQKYTGRIVEPTLFDGSTGSIKVYLTAADKREDKFVNNPEDYVRIVSYANNTKTGTGKVTLAGVGEYGGTRVCTFKISKKEYMPILVDKVTLTSTMAPGQTVLPFGETAEITATIEPEEAENKTIVWTTSNAKLVAIESTEKIDDTHVKATVRAVGNGAATIKAISQGTGKFASVVIKAQKIPVSGITITPLQLTKNVGDEFNLNVTFSPADAYLGDVQWISTSPTVATIDNEGVVRCVGPGVAVIYVTSGNVSANCIVTVNGPSSDIINVTEHDVMPNDGIDDAVNIRKLINEYCSLDGVTAGKTLYFPAGTYNLSYGDSDMDNSCIYVGHGVSINFLLDDNAILKADRFDGSVEDYNVVRFDRSVNCSITGGKIVGDRQNTGSPANYEGGMGIGIMKGKSITISNVDISQCWGDGIWIGDASSGYDGVRDSYYIAIMNCNVHNNRRNNMSIVGAKYLTVIGSKFNYASGKAPQYGVDIEPNASGVVEHVTFNNCEFKGNGSAAFGIIKSASDVVFNNCSFSGMIYNMAGRNIKFHGCSISGGELYDDAGGATWD
ncbi:MAG: Ig-like domain-containing protein [Lachnospiraceae bacterium]|nr:Ig-like domain-containing protein [Candidatus Colinaster scatohippi]